MSTALAEAIVRACPGCAVEALEVLPGGHSGLTHLATVIRPDGQRERVVVKSTPPGRTPRGRHDVLRQARMLEALGGWGGVPTPAVAFTAEEPVNAFGMAFADGVAAEPVMEEARPDETPAGVSAAWHGAVDLLVALQRATPERLGLAHEPVESPLEELDRWRATMHAGGLDVSDPAAIRLAARLADTAPEPLEACVVHGDFRLGNMLQRSGDIRALVDWEIWTLGDPRSDIGWLCLFTDASNFPGLGRQAPGTPTADAIVERWRVSRDGDGAGVGWFRGLACFKLAAIQAHNLRRHVEGRYHDPHQERLLESTRVLVARGLSLAG
jgi:aminoglycoside phosphotransferase (APT) family kinase protein